MLVVDCDPQANATAGLGVSPESAQKNMYDVFMSRVDGFPQVKMTDIIRSTESGIDLAPASLDLVGAEPYLYGIASRAEVLRDALLPLREKYDLILIDTPPSMGQFVINGLFAADHIIVTLDSGSFALNGVGPLFTIFEDMKQDLGKELHVDMAIISRWGEGGEMFRTCAGNPGKKRSGELAPVTSCPAACPYRRRKGGRGRACKGARAPCRYACRDREKVLRSTYRARILPKSTKPRNGVCRSRMSPLKAAPGAYTKQLQMR